MSENIGEGLKRVLSSSEGRKLLALLRHWFREKWTQLGLRKSPSGVRFGSLRRLKTIARSFWERGLPVDRDYLEGFLMTHALDVAGHVVEIGDDAYTRRFGGGRVQQSDVLDVDSENKRATIVVDLSALTIIPRMLMTA